MLDLNFDLETETPIEDIIDEKITEGPVKSIAKTMSRKIKKDENKKYTCICGSILNIKSKKKHEQSLKHLKYK